MKMFLVHQTLSVDGCSIDPSKLLIFLKKSRMLQLNQGLHIKKLMLQPIHLTI